MQTSTLWRFFLFLTGTPDFVSSHQITDMKKIIPVILVVSILFAFNLKPEQEAGLKGAWTSVQGSITNTLVFQDGYFSFCRFDIPGKKFIRTFGGTYTESGGQLHATIEFDTETKENVGKHMHFPVSVQGNNLKISPIAGITGFSRTDNGISGLSGNWRITGRMNNGQMQDIPLRARKTLKILSETRFQWMAINTETGEFSGSGGGTYSFTDGKYTENIEFFSRDSSRVGASLSFEGSISNNVWTHKGLSSRGDPIHEEWTRENPQ